MKYELRTNTHIADRPYIMLVCRESYQVTMENLRGSIPAEAHTSWKYEKSDPCSPKKIRFDPSKDIIYLPGLNEIRDWSWGKNLQERLRYAFKDIEKILIPAGVLYKFEGKVVSSVSSNVFPKLRDIVAVVQNVKGKERSYEFVDLTEGKKIHNRILIYLLYKTRS